MTTSLADIRARAEKVKKTIDLNDYISKSTITVAKGMLTLANDIEKLLKIVEIQSEALNYYFKMKAICRHDDSSWCDHCPDGGYRARKAIEKADAVLGEK